METIRFAFLLALLFNLRMATAHNVATPPTKVLSSLEEAEKNCLALQEKLRAIPGIQMGYAQVPKFHSQPNAEKLKVFWWKRPGQDQSYPPLVHLHGGIGGDSSLVLMRLQSVIETYPGDLIAWDHRGEGCSKTLPGNLHPREYEAYRIRETAKDIDYLRTQVFNVKKWRLFGQSRGSMMAYYAAEMDPQGIESLHLSAGIVLPERLQSEMTRIRTEGFARLMDEYLKEYPQDADTVAKARQMIPADKCWIGLDGIKLCGPGVMDVMTKGMGRRASWPDFHKKLETLTDPEIISQTLQQEVNGDVYSQFGYLMGTNGIDASNPDFQASEIYKKTDLFTRPMFSELRYVVNIIAPQFNFNWDGGVAKVNFARLKRNIIKNEIKTFSYNSDTDPIFTQEMVDWTKRYFGPFMTFIHLEKTGHNDAWYHPATLENIVKKSYQ